MSKFEETKKETQNAIAYAQREGYDINSKIAIAWAILALAEAVNESKQSEDKTSLFSPKYENKGEKMSETDKKTKLKEIAEKVNEDEHYFGNKTAEIFKEIIHEMEKMDERIAKVEEISKRVIREVTAAPLNR